MPLDPLKQYRLREEIEHDPSLNFNATHQKLSRQSALATFPWLLVIILSFLSLYLYREEHIRPSQSNGWETDFGKSSLQDFEISRL